MDYSEKDIENKLIESDHLLEEYGIEVIAQQFKTEYGIIDILGYDSESNQIVVIELKKGLIDENAVGQIMRYLSAMRDIIAGCKGSENVPEHIVNSQLPYGLLIGANATDGALAIIRSFSFLKYAQVNVSISVTTFMHDYSRVEESLLKDVANYKNTGALDMIEGLYQEQLEIDRHFKENTLEAVEAE